MEDLGAAGRSEKLNSENSNEESRHAPTASTDHRKASGAFGRATEAVVADLYPAVLHISSRVEVVVVGIVQGELDTAGGSIRATVGAIGRSVGTACVPRIGCAIAACGCLACREARLSTAQQAARRWHSATNRAGKLDSSRRCWHSSRRHSLLGYRCVYLSMQRSRAAAADGAEVAGD